MGPIVNQYSQLASWLDPRPERDHLWVEAGERDPGHLPKCDHLLVVAAERDLDHSPKRDHLLVGAVERDLDRSPKLQGLSCEMRTLSQHSPRQDSANPLLRLEQATPKRLP
jgi:hypothetical protein